MTFFYRDKKRATTVYITEDQRDMLKMLSARTAIPQAILIREGVDLVLKDPDEALRRIQRQKIQDQSELEIG